MRKEILLMIFFVTILFMISNGVFAGTGNLSKINLGNLTRNVNSITGANFTGSVLLNLTFVNATDVIVPMNGTGGNGSIALNVTFWGRSSNGTNYKFGTTQNCANMSATEWACWMTYTLNSTLDGYWRIYANTSNISTSTDPAGWQNSAPFSNATNIIFDSTPPNVSAFVSPTWGSGTNRTSVLVRLNITVNDSIFRSGQFLDNASLYYSGLVMGGVFYNITNSLGVQNVTYFQKGNDSAPSAGGAQSFWIYQLNTSHLANGGLYTITVWANDSLNNVNNSQSLIFYLDLANPTITGTKNDNSTQTSISATLSVTNAYTGLNGQCTVDRSGATIGGTYLGSGTKTLYLGESSLQCNKAYSYIVSCASYAGLSSVQTLTYTTDGCSSSSGTGGSSGGTTSTWTNTVVASNEELSAEGITKQLATKNRIEVKVGGAKHYVGVSAISGTTATIEISSNPVTVKLNIGEDAKVDLNGDGTYDMYIKLNSITNNKADVSVTKISEAIPAGKGAVSTSGEQVGAGGGTTTPPPSTTTSGTGNKAWVWIIVIVLIVIIVGAGVAIKKRK